jgi:hypothetical protein
MAVACVCGAGQGVVLSELSEFVGLESMALVCVCGGGEGVILSENTELRAFWGLE